MSKNIFFLFLSLSISQLGFAQVDKYLKDAQKALEANNFDEAEIHLMQALEEYQSDATANWAMGVFYLKRGPQENALAYIAKAVNATENPSPKMYRDYAKALHANYKFDAAAEAYKKSDPKGEDKYLIKHYIEQTQNGKRYLANPVKAQVINMKSVNTKYPEYMPYVSADQQRMFFTARWPNTTGEKKAADGEFYEDIYVCFNRGGHWAKARKLQEPVNGKYHDACIGISTDGQTMYLYKGTNGGDIYYTKLKGKRWTKPQPMPFNTEHYESQVAVTPDNKEIYFVSDRDGSKDIWSTYINSKGQWSTPRKLGGIVNTPYNETSPFFASDGQTLYFSSDGHTSMGGQDIFRIQLKGAKSSGAPENLGYPINTTSDDMYFSLDPKEEVGYYSSNKRGSKGKQDLYMIQMPERKQKPNLAILKGKVVDEFTNKPIEAKITITDNEKNEEVADFTSNASTGEYVVALPSGVNYGITIEKDGHLFHSENVYLTDKEGYKEIVKDVRLAPVKKGSKVVLNNIFFETASSQIQRESVPELEKLVNLLKRAPDLRIEVSGHTDNTGNPQSNQKLSEDRAKSVKEYLISKGIAASRIEAKGYGQEQPIATNNSVEGRARNRRTEFKIL